MPIIPPLLSAGDKVAILSPSRVIYPEQLEKALEVFENWGLAVVSAPNLYASDGYLAGTDEQRLEEWEWAMELTDVKAIFCARGGYGLTRIIDSINLQPLADNPKWIIGFSDITAMHLKLAKMDLASLHALMPVQFAYEGIEKSLESLYQFLFNGNIDYKIDGDGLSAGRVIAPVTGGNLSLLAESLGTPTEISTDNRILFIEEIDEYLYKVDRMLNQLFRAGKFDQLKGVIIGDFSDLQDTSIPFGKSFRDICLRYFNDDYPVAWQIPIGHENYNLALPMNLPLELDVSTSVTRIRLHTHPRPVS